MLPDNIGKEKSIDKQHLFFFLRQARILPHTVQFKSQKQPGAQKRMSIGRYQYFRLPMFKQPIQHPGILKIIVYLTCIMKNKHRHKHPFQLFLHILRVFSGNPRNQTIDDLLQTMLADQPTSPFNHFGRMFLQRFGRFSGTNMCQIRIIFQPAEQ